MNRCRWLQVCPWTPRWTANSLRLSAKRNRGQIGNKGDKQTDKQQTKKKTLTISAASTHHSCSWQVNQLCKDLPSFGNVDILFFFFWVAQMKLANVAVYAAGGGCSYRRTVGAAGVSARLVNFHSSPCWLAGHFFRSTLSCAGRPSAAQWRHQNCKQIGIKHHF